MIDNIQKIKEFLVDPQRIYQETLANNSEFRKFVKENENKTTEELATEYNIGFILQ